MSATLRVKCEQRVPRLWGLTGSHLLRDTQCARTHTANSHLLSTHQEGLSLLEAGPGRCECKHHVLGSSQLFSTVLGSSQFSPHAFNSTLSEQFCSNSSSAGQVSALTACVASTGKYQRHCSFKTLDFGVFLLWGNYGFHRSITECGLSIPDAVEIAGL